MTHDYPLFSFDPCAKTTNGVPYKVYRLKRKIIEALAHQSGLTVQHMAKRLGVSAPTISKVVAELIGEGYLYDKGKIETVGGRRPSSFALEPKAGYFLGVELGEYFVRFAWIDMGRTVIDSFQFDLEAPADDPHRMLDRLVEMINQAIERAAIHPKKVLGVGLVLGGRVNSASGRSYTHLSFADHAVADLLSKRVGIRVVVENDTRAVTYAEYIGRSETQSLHHSLFLLVDRGVGVGIVVDGALYYGKSGFSGEFGHTPFFENQRICTCGKVGCLETEVSGRALERMFDEAMARGASSILSERYAKNSHIPFETVLEAAQAGDVLSIELIGIIGEKLGRGVGVLVNIFNPEAIIVGGVFATAGDYLMLPLRVSLAKYSHALVNNDLVLMFSNTGAMGAAVGGALLTRSRVLAV